MIHMFEYNYMQLVAKVLAEGETRQTRNAETISLFGESLVIDMEGTNRFPLLQGRQMYHKGILGEFAAIIRQPKHIDDFRKWGCNYWEKWCKPDGSINVDYGNAWFRGNQIAKLKAMLRGDPTNRRMLITGWDPTNVDNLDLPCCHYAYQFYVRDGKFLDMVWTQRSADLMIGVPSDIVFGYAWMISLANEFGLVPGRLKMDLGDIHIYKQHLDSTYEYIYRVRKAIEAHQALTAPVYVLEADKGANFLDFEPNQLVIKPYDNLGKLNFELVA